MKKNAGVHDSRVLQILDDIERLRSDDFTHDAVADILKALERQMANAADSGPLNGRVVSNDAVQGYIDGSASRNAVPPFMGRRSETDDIISPPITKPVGRSFVPQAIVSKSSRGKSDQTESSPEELPPSPPLVTSRSLGLLPLAPAYSVPSFVPGPVTPPPSDDEGEEQPTAILSSVARTGPVARLTSLPRTSLPRAGLPPIESEAPAPRQKTIQYRHNDVLFGRGGLSNHHAGNKRYREEVDRVKPVYRQSDMTKKQKTEIRNKLVDTVRGYGGRFLKYEEGSEANGQGGWVEVTLQQARRKASQALREERRRG